MGLKLKEINLFNIITSIFIPFNFTLIYNDLFCIIDRNINKIKDLKSKMLCLS